MTIYFLKVILCSTLFLGYYHLILQKEKTYRFNRFYLLFSLLAPFIIPLIEIEDSSAPINIPQVETVFIPTQKIQPLTIEKEIFINPKQPSEINIPLLIYTLVSTVLLVIFLKNIFVLIKEIRSNEKVVLGKVSIVLLDKNITPYSFLKYIFVNREEYEKQGIEREILLHESTHIKQAHSIDILIIEFIKIFFWFNPLLIFYKKVIQLNHEFLADEAVINTYRNVKNYQVLLLEKVSQSNNFLFTSSFNYSITKQRLQMMTKSTSKTKALLIILAFVPLFACAIFTFSTKIYAQKSTPESKEKRLASTKEGASDEMIAEYAAIIKKHLSMLTDSKGLMKALQDINKNKADSERLKIIFNTMTYNQQYKQSVKVLSSTSMILPPTTPTEKEFENFKDPTKYGVWLNDRKVENLELNKYKATDFGQFFISKLYGKARFNSRGEKLMYGYQLDMMTNDYYEKYQKEALSNPKQHYLVMDWEKLKAELSSK